MLEDAMAILILWNNGERKGFAYMEFRIQADAEKTFRGRDQRLMGNPFPGTSPERKVKMKTIDVERKALGVLNQKLVLRNVPYSATEETLQGVFKRTTSISVL